MSGSLAVLVLAALAVFLLAFGLTAWVAPSRVGGFLRGFATTARRHFIELLVRLVVGGAFWIAAPATRFETAFEVAGAVLVGTTLALGAIPWRRHRDFAARSVPHAQRFLSWLGGAAIAVGALLVYALAAGA